MKNEGPGLSELLQRTRAVSPIALKPDAAVYPIICDFLRAHQVAFDAKLIRDKFLRGEHGVMQAPHIALAVWLYSLPSLANADWSGVVEFFDVDLGELGSVVAIEAIVEDEQRREEFVRRCLLAVGLRPAGESEKLSEDRLKTLDSIESLEMELESKRRIERAMQVAAEMKKKAAEAAAAKVSRE